MKVDQEVLEVAFEEARLSTGFSVVLPPDCFSLREVKLHGSWWEVCIEMSWHTLNEDEIPDETLPLQRWLHRIAVDVATNEVIGAVFDVEE